MRTLLASVAAGLLMLGVTSIADAQKGGRGGNSGHGQAKQGKGKGQGQANQGQRQGNQGQANKGNRDRDGRGDRDDNDRDGRGGWNGNWTGNWNGNWNRPGQGNNWYRNDYWRNGRWYSNAWRWYGNNWRYGNYGRYNRGYGYPYYGGGYYSSYPYYDDYGSYADYDSTANAPPPGPTPDQAMVHVILPDANADVVLNGQKIPSSGRERDFFSRRLELGRQYSYTVTASWLYGGRPVSDTRVVVINPGQVSVVDFTRPALAQLNTPPALR